MKRIACEIQKEDSYPQTKEKPQKEPIEVRLVAYKIVRRQISVIYATHFVVLCYSSQDK
jgi:hypothetical protein